MSGGRSPKPSQNPIEQAMGNALNNPPCPITPTRSCFSIKLHSKTRAVWACLGVNSLDDEARENALNNPPCPITLTLTSSSLHHSSHQLTTTFLLYYNVT